MCMFKCTKFNTSCFVLFCNLLYFSSALSLALIVCALLGTIRWTRGTYIMQNMTFLYCVSFRWLDNDFAVSDFFTRWILAVFVNTVFLR